MLSVLVPFRVAVLPPFLQCVVVSLAAVAVVAAGAVRSSLPLSQMEGGARARRWGCDSDGRCPLSFEPETRKTRFVGIPKTLWWVSR